MCIEVAKVATGGLFRLGEITATPTNKGKVPKLKDLSVPRHKCRKIHLDKSKKDKFGMGDSVVLATNGSTVDPVVAIDNVLKLVHKKWTRDRPLFCDLAGKPVKACDVIKRLKIALKKAGVPSKGYSGHSFRKGGAQALLDAGASYADIMIAGRWSSDCWKLYVVLSDNLAIVNSARMAFGVGAD